MYALNVIYKLTQVSFLLHTGAIKKTPNVPFPKVNAQMHTLLWNPSASSIGSEGSKDPDFGLIVKVQYPFRRLHS